jgi:hydrogenase maturation protein HypF
MRQVQALRIRVRGTVQGVGFRPFVHRLALRHGLAGWVRNTGGAVELEIEGEPCALDAFLAALPREAPPLARIAELEAEARPPAGRRAFRIVESAQDGGWQAIPPDTATCADCLREVFDPRDRRYRYPFTNCTQCGPRFTIIESLPYDRPRTTMRAFPMCDACRREYEDPADRRFHAEPVACPACGPQLEWRAADGSAFGDAALARCVAALRAGAIVAVKGLGGVHLACDARNDDAVRRLRARKQRGAKPFALMVPDGAWAERLGQLGPVERDLLEGPERPIVLLRRRRESAVSEDVAAGLDTLGVMLPYTPLHHLLLREFGGPLVMTSGNLSEEPIAKDNEEALARLASVADAFLLHDRGIRARYDDSVVRVIDGAPVLLRRARGYAPVPVPLGFTAAREVLAVGGQQKNTFCAVKGPYAFVSPHIGDLDHPETVAHFLESLAHYRSLFRLAPELVAHDLHPDYVSTRIAEGLAPPERRVAVQHHHAHVASCMAEHGLAGPVIGVAYDGTGYGTDGAVWGGEVLVVDLRTAQRAAHFRYAPMPGGESAIRKPYRMAAALLWSWFGEDDRFERFWRSIPPGERDVLRRMVSTGTHAPLTSSCGRLFDAVSALLGVCREASYDGQPAAELEALADPATEDAYPLEVREGEGPGTWVLDPAETLLRAWLDDERGRPPAEIAGAFHNAVASATAEVCRRIARATGLRRVCLTGGCFQNRLLAERTRALLERLGLEVFAHRAVPPNDGGLSLGQAVVAHARAEAGAV